MKKTLILVLSIISLIFSANSDIFAKPTAESIKEAVKARNSYFKRVMGDDISKKVILSPTKWVNKLNSNRQKNSWYYFLTGVVWNYNHQSPDKAFRLALNIAKNDQGSLWVLYNGFDDISADEWSSQALFYLKRLYISHGVTDAPVIRSQLQLLSKKAYLSNDKDRAEKYLSEANQFSNLNYYQNSTRFFIGASDDITLYTAIKDFITELRASWIVQLHLISIVNKILKIITFIFIFVVLSLMAAKYYTKSIHSLSCLYPQSSPYKMRLLYISVLLLALTSISFYPVILLITFLLLIHSKKILHKNLLRVSFVLLLIYPSTSYITLFINQALSEQYPITIFKEAADGIPSMSLRNRINGYLNRKDLNDETKALILTSRALYEYKLANKESALYYINQAIETSPNSEPVLIAAGTISSGNKMLKKSREYFQKAVELYPQSLAANYNYGQICLEDVSTIDGSNYIKTAKTINPILVNKFIKDNAFYFDKRHPWPTIRHYFLSDISPKQFWKNGLSYMVDITDNVRYIWGKSFFGIPPLISIITTLLILLIYSMIDTSHKKRKNRKVGSCTLCGRPVCTKCHKEEYCGECYESVHTISNETLVEALKVKLSTSNRHNTRVKGLIMEMLFPGSKLFYLKSKDSKNISMLLLPLTMIVYTSYIALATEPLTIFPEASGLFKLIILIVLLSYNTIFIIKFVKALKKENSSNRI